MNTLTEHGHVTRGVCKLDDKGNLAGVDERFKIMWRNGTVEYEEDGAWHIVEPDATVSMNMWGFTPSLLKEIEEGFPAFLDAAYKADPVKAEYLLPLKIDELLKESKAIVKVLPTDERWFGITYKEDKEQVTASVQSMKDRGLYPETLW